VRFRLVGSMCSLRCSACWQYVGGEEKEEGGGAEANVPALFEPISHRPACLIKPVMNVVLVRSTLFWWEGSVRDRAHALVPQLHQHS
jgi:hypothetical protein